MAEDAWNSREPQRVSLAYTPDSRWRNRSEFFEYRAYGNEQWKLNAEGLMQRREASINDVRVNEACAPSRPPRTYGVRNVERRS
jgi:hypothetical protein